MICNAADLQSGHPVLACNASEIGEETVADCLAEKWLAILCAEYDVIM
jgi:hypothetical protein